MKKILVSVHGFIGDILLSQPIAEKLKQENQAYEVDFLVGFPQPIRLLEKNPYIDRVLYYEDYIGENTHHIAYSIQSQYDEVRYVKKYNGNPALTVAHQLSAGVKSPTSKYTVYTDVELDKKAQQTLSTLDSRPKIGICATWRTTPTEFGFHYDSSSLAKELSKKFNVIIIGLPPNKNQYDGATKNCQYEYAYMASIGKQLDLIIGGEGGLINLFAGVGTKILYTTDFIWHLAGPQGELYQHENPIEILGPKAYFPNKNHIFLPYSVKSDRYQDEILKILNKIF
jgi:ADP-heptose:LPS heptosyltransferase